MIAFVEERPSGKRLVLLNEVGDLVYSRRVECEPKAQGVLAPIVSKEQYDADRHNALLSRGSGVTPNNRNTNVVPLPRGAGRRRK